MEKKSVRVNKKTGQPITKQGGARPGSGRPKGSTDKLTIEGLLQSVKDKSKGRGYEELLVEDFLQSRDRGDSHLTIKYHNLILNKVMGTLNKIEVTDSQDQLEMKQQAFAEALSKITGIKKD